jgi:Zn-dependent M28 family amino/carboxypeptidase
MILSLGLWLGQLQPAKSFVDAVDAETLKRHVFFLASDDLKGRQTPSEGLDKAADYIAAHLKKVGVRPGNGGSYFQETTWRETDKSVRNVIGIVPGSDPALAKSYVIVSAHYDHLGETTVGEDKIFNGANDNASSVAGILEVAEAVVLAKPKRSVILMAFYGEEKGLVGAGYYVKNPVYPLKDTIANINVEQIGRTDDEEGPRVKALSMTGFEFSTVGKTFAEVNKGEVGISGHPQYSGAFFTASDNFMFARAGVPAHTLCTAFMFSDYHRVSDHADKLNYDNMATVTKAISRGVVAIANQVEVPTWVKGDKRVEKFALAAEKLRTGQ